MKSKKEIIDKIEILQIRIDSGNYSGLVLEMESYRNALKWVLE